MLNLNLKQVISIIIAILGVLMISTTQLTDLFGAGTAKSIVSVSALLNSILGSVMAVITSQSGTVKDVMAMPGVERIRVNEQANETLAKMAVDSTQNKILPTPQAQGAVEEIAKGI